ncbi:unnamed protein product [Pylaiella littoralis]
MEEARLMIRMREAHSMALRRSAANLPPEELQKQVAPVQGKVGDVDPAALAAKAVARIVEKSEEAFGKLCERMSVNEKLLALERANEQQQERLLRQQKRAEELRHDRDGGSLSELMGETPPLPGGRQPAELVREATMELKLAERARLLALAEEAERLADEEAAKVKEIEVELQERLRLAAATQQALAEASSSFR